MVSIEPPSSPHYEAQAVGLSKPPLYIEMCVSFFSWWGPNYLLKTASWREGLLGLIVAEISFHSSLAPSRPWTEHHGDRSLLGRLFTSWQAGSRKLETGNRGNRNPQRPAFGDLFPPGKPKISSAYQIATYLWTFHIESLTG